jgi:Asp-tRNA(Asn)/Glu-tRNA(Gln) amidotransferase A subunit family amidase
MPRPADRLRHAPLCTVLHALATGETTSAALTDACLAAIERDAGLSAWLHVDADGARRAAAESDARRAEGRTVGRLDGIPLGIKDNFDVAGQPTTAGLAARRGRIAAEDAHVVSKLRGAGAVLLGKTALDEAAFGVTGRNPHYGDTRNPRDAAVVAGGSSGGSAAAVAAGHAIAALGSDTMGSVRIPATYCGVVGLKPTFGELSTHGMAPLLRRTDCPGFLVRGVQDATVLLQVTAGYDARDPRSRKRRVPMAPPDWTPGVLRAGIVDDLARLGAAPDVLARFDDAVQRALPIFGSCAPAALQLESFDVVKTRRAALLMMEAELLATHGADLEGCSDRVKQLLQFAKDKPAVAYAHADKGLDTFVVRVRKLFERFDVLMLPVAPTAPLPTDADEPDHTPDFTAVASLAGCPALALPLGQGIGLQLVGAPGSDLRLLELGEILAAVLDAGD